MLPRTQLNFLQSDFTKINFGIKRNTTKVFLQGMYFFIWPVLR